MMIVTVEDNENGIRLIKSDGRNMRIFSLTDEEAHHLYQELQEIFE